MLSNFDIEEIAHFYKIDIVVVMKDELIKIKPTSGNYLINLESSKDGNGTHWVALRIEDFNCVYFDSYGYLPPKEIITFCKRIHKSQLAYNTKEIQNLSTVTCGFFALAFLLFLHFKKQIISDIFSRSSAFLKYFTTVQKTTINTSNYFIENYPIHQIYKSLKRNYIIKNN